LLIIISICADGKEINRCTGIVVGRDEVKKSVTILTSAWIICTEKPINDWLDKKYAPQAKVKYLSRHLAVAFHVMTNITSFIFVKSEALRVRWFIVNCRRTQYFPLLIIYILFQVVVHLLDGTTVDSELMYFSKHYDVAFFEIIGGLHLQSLPLEANLELGQEAFVLARERNLDLICKQAKMESVDPCENQHNHYQFITGSIPNTVIIFILCIFT
jgi:hypothetical protein